MTELTPEVIHRLPKTDLHVHLDGSLRIPTLIELAKERKVKLPSYTVEGLRELVFKESYKNLPEYLEGFMYTTAVMIDAEAIERIAYEFCLDNQAEGVRYVEVRFAPQLSVKDGLSMSEVVNAADRGLRRAAKEFNALPSVTEGREPSAGAFGFEPHRYNSPQHETDLSARRPQPNSRRSVNSTNGSVGSWWSR